MDQRLAGPTRHGHAELARRPPFALGAAEVRPATREVVGPGGREVVEPRVMQVLAALADARGETLTRDDLLDRCWGGTVVDDGAINRVIAKVRRLAEGVAAGSFTIETITKVGYRLVLAEPHAAVPPPSRPAPDAVAVRRRTIVAGGLVAGLTAVAGGAYWSLAGRGGPPSLAGDLHERGVDALRYMLPDRDAQAIALLDEAVRLEPGYAAAWGTLALAHQRAAEFGPPGIAEAAAVRTQVAARRALALDADNADGQVALALVAPVYRDWTAAEMRYRRLLGRHPDHAPLLAGYAKMQSEVGRFDAAMSTMDRVFELEPLSPGYHWRRALGLWAAGRPDEAEQLIARALRLWPGHLSIWFAAFWLFAYLGRTDDALGLLGGKVAAAVPPAETAFMRRSALALSGREPAAVADAVRLNIGDARAGTTVAEHAMAVASAVGAVDAAHRIAAAYYFDTGFSVGDRRLEDGTFMAPTRRKTLPLFWPPTRNLRADRRFDALVESLGLDDYWRRSRLQPDFRAG